MHMSKGYLYMKFYIEHSRDWIRVQGSCGSGYEFKFLARSGFNE